MGNKAMKDFIDDTSRCKTQSDKSESDEEKEIEDLFQAEVDEAEQKYTAAMIDKQWIEYIEYTSSLKSGTIRRG